MLKKILPFIIVITASLLLSVFFYKIATEVYGDNITVLMEYINIYYLVYLFILCVCSWFIISFFSFLTSKLFNSQGSFNEVLILGGHSYILIFILYGFLYFNSDNDIMLFSEDMHKISNADPNLVEAYVYQNPFMSKIKSLNMVVFTVILLWYAYIIYRWGKIQFPYAIVSAFLCPIVIYILSYLIGYVL